ncbi:MAG: adenylate kinase [Candidatus Hodarchaeales archaeon]|jgi:adenylate kinase
MKFIMLGPPGSGKGTQAKFIQIKYAIPQISTGDLLRNAIESQSEVGIKANEFINTGILVPDEIVLQLLKARLNQNDCKLGFILDGFPRNLTQALELEKITSIDLVLYIEADPNVIIERITGRRTCQDCGEIYHIKHNPPSNRGICDKCSGLLYQRDDDTEETVEKRLKTYEKETRPLINYYKQQEILKTLISDGTIDEMRSKVQNLITSLYSPLG